MTALLLTALNIAWAIMCFTTDLCVWSHWLLVMALVFVSTTHRNGQSSLLHAHPVLVSVVLFLTSRWPSSRRLSGSCSIQEDSWALNREKPSSIQGSYGGSPTELVFRVSVEFWSSCCSKRKNKKTLKTQCLFILWGKQASFRYLYTRISL